MKKTSSQDGSDTQSIVFKIVSSKNLPLLFHGRINLGRFSLLRTAVYEKIKKLKEGKAVQFAVGGNPDPKEIKAIIHTIYSGVIVKFRLPFRIKYSAIKKIFIVAKKEDFKNVPR